MLTVNREANTIAIRPEVNKIEEPHEGNGRHNNTFQCLQSSVYSQDDPCLDTNLLLSLT